MSGDEGTKNQARAHEGTYDYIVVGAGSAGCVLANRLTEEPHTVLLLEAGGPDTDKRIHIPREFEELQGTDMDWQYVTEPEPGLGNRPIPWPRGKVLGGSSSINALLYIRGNPQDYDGWADMGNSGWSYKDVLPYFIKSETNTRPGISSQHGRHGPLTVSDINPPNPASKAFLAAAMEVGLGATDDFNDGEQLGGASLYQVTIKDGLRSSSATAYLTKEVKSRANLKIATHANVTRLAIEDGRAVGVEYIDTTKPDKPARKVAKAKREVILCGGTVNSPQLLMLSGVGPTDDLKKLGIKIAVHLPGVGLNLQDHPIAAVLYLYKNGQSAPAAAGGVEGGLFIRTRKKSDTADIQYHFTHKILGRPPAPPADAGYMIVATLVKPLSRGFLKLRSSNPEQKPEIHANYLTENEDMRSLVAGIKLGRKIGEAAAFDGLRGMEASPGTDAQTDEQIAAKIRETAIGLFHPVGTCKMGPDPREGAVVDARLRVHGVKGLRVVDASIMPVITTGNPNAPTVMIAEKASDMIREDARKDGEGNMSDSERSFLGILERIADSISEGTAILGRIEEKLSRTADSPPGKPDAKPQTDDQLAQPSEKVPPTN